eukprot:GFUD01001984.1.p1 GENE.GFUD01001984.1~~GFUD01001984.1.p1  ORF type:complete len:358 (+),score=83.95 GFUD01001984.1:63-1136(+)
MSGVEVNSEVEEKAWFGQELVRESGDLSVSMDTIGEDMVSVGTVSGASQIFHLGPVSQKDRFISLMEQAMPYLVLALSLIVLILIPALASTISKVHSVDAQGSHLAESLNRVEREGQDQTKRVQDLFETKLAGVEIKAGPPGEKGSSGRRGEKGNQGEDGGRGVQGRQGVIGVKGGSGEKGQQGDQGVKGEKGLQGPKGDSGLNTQTLGTQGPKGEPGPVGPKGEKGDTYIPLLTWDWTHAAGNKGDRFDFKIVCLQRCKSLKVTIIHSVGDVDLYGEADDVPHIVNSNCDRCEQCKARSSQKKDTCFVDRAPSTTFYITVYTHKAYKDMEIAVEASNLKSVTCMSGNCEGIVLAHE